MAMQRLKPFEDRIVWLYLRSDEAVDKIPDMLDFVYIDGNHSYEYVKRDIENYHCLVKPGGFVGGHDYTSNIDPRYVIKVKKAVDEFVTKYGYKLFVRPYRKSDDWPDWWVRTGTVHFIWFGPAALGYADFLAVKTAALVYGVAPYVWLDAVPENEWLSRIREISIQGKLKMSG